MKTLTVKLSEPLDEALVQMAKQRGTTRSAVVREAVEALIRGRPASRKRSPLALARDLAGSIDGPADLSSNPRHLVS